MQLPKKFSEYIPITDTDGEEVIPILKDGANETVKAKSLAVPDSTQAALDGKENAFSKGSLVEGENVTIDGPLDNRLVGEGDVTISTPVGSVNDKVGDVELNAADVGADPAGSAATAEGNANSFTSSEIAELGKSVLPEPGSLPFRDPGLEAWYSDILDTTNPIDLVVFGDSIGDNFGWPDGLAPHLLTRFNPGLDLKQVIPHVGVATADAANGRRMNGTVQGTPNTTGLAGFGTNLTNGQFADGTYNCNGVIVVWGEGTGTLTVKNGGSGGTVVATIDTSTGDGNSNLTPIDLGSYGSKHIYIESTGNSHLEAIYMTVGNLTAGIRVWNVCRSGTTTTAFLENPGRGLDLIRHLKELTGREPHVIVSTGLNDAYQTYYETMKPFIQAVKAETDGSILLWAPWGSGGVGIPGRSFGARQLAAEDGIALVDTAKMLGDIGHAADYYNLSSDQVHADSLGLNVMIMGMLAALTNDIVGALATMIINPQALITWRGNFNSDYSRVNPNGNINIGSFFGFPILSIMNSNTDTQAQVAFYTANVAFISNFLNSAAIAFGEGGSSNPDVVIQRSAAGTLSVQTSATTQGELTTNLRRIGSASPEGSVTAPQGAIYQRTNGQLWLKITGSGNTGWQQIQDTTGGQVDSVVAGTGIDVDNDDPENPEVSLDSATQASLGLADSAVQDLNDLGITATATELNVLDGIPATLTAAELGYMDGVTSAVQTQLDAKVPRTTNTDNRAMRADGTTGALQDSLVVIDDSGGVTSPVAFDSNFGASGRILSGNLFGPLFAAFSNAANTQPNALLSPLGIYFGPGGATPTDSGIERLGVGQLSMTDAQISRARFHINAQTGTTFTPALTDGSKLITLTNANPITFTVPTNTGVAFPVGTNIQLIQMGAGQVTIAPFDGTVTVNGTPGLKTRVQYSAVTLVKLGVNAWVATGDLSA